MWKKTKTYSIPLTLRVDDDSISKSPTPAKVGILKISPVTSVSSLQPK